MSIKNNILLPLLLILFIGCTEEHQRAIYQPTEKDSLNFLVTNANFIGVIEIYDGIKRPGNSMSVILTDSANAKIKSLLKGELTKDSIINISSSTLHNRPGSVKTSLALRNGEYVAFLVKVEEIFKPLTPYSLIEIHSVSDTGRPIWKQTKSKYVDRPNVPKDEIINEIKNIIEQINSADAKSRVR